MSENDKCKIQNSSDLVWRAGDSVGVHRCYYVSHMSGIFCSYFFI